MHVYMVTITFSGTWNSTDRFVTRHAHTHLDGNVDAVVEPLPQVELSLGNHHVFEERQLFGQRAVAPVNL